MQRFALGRRQAGLDRRLGALIVNYTDDLVICCRGDDAHTALNAMRMTMNRLKLTEDEERTGICRIPDGEFDLLRYTFGRRHSPKTGREHWDSSIAEKWPKHVSRQPEYGMVGYQRNGKQLNQKLGRWANYFKLGPVELHPSI